jgi:hypothetical protein
VTRYTNRRKRRDANHAAIVGALQRAGYAVLDLSQVGGSCPDVLCAKHGVQVLLEFKSPGEDLSDEQQAFVKRWPGPVAMVRTPEEAIMAMRLELFP